ncbi:MAG: HAD-IIA family hydrolase [Bifidobacteriaceae bacterium]|jgi:HAD superfamily hydrolase (TIGR01450 family)|nr:HAD-IIA family hydrolase [Bifidobacteriaceae bacterium]
MNRPGTGLIDVPEPLSHHFDVALTDMDGVLFRGNEPMVHAADQVGRARQRGMKFIFVTNNASRPPRLAAAKLGSMRIPADRDDVITSAQSGVSLMAEHIPAGSGVMAVGGNGLTEAVTKAGFKLVTAAIERPAAVIQGLSPALQWRDLEEAAYAIEAGAAYFATNLDKNLPTEFGFAPGNGAMVQALVVTTGVVPKASGKPHALIFHLAAERGKAERPVVIGDRLDTDIRGANNAGYPGLLVLTGVSKAVDALMAGPAERPSLIARDLRALSQPHQAPVREGAYWVCGQARSWVDGNRVVLEDAGSASDDAVVSEPALRAALAAGWFAADQGVLLDRESIPANLG